MAQETGYKDVMDKSVSLTQLFLIFFKMGAFTIGGGYAMIPLIEKELTKREWISEEDLQDIVVLAQSAPGLLAVNMAIYSGYRLAGLKGSIVASVGAVLPSFVIILAIIQRQQGNSEHIPGCKARSCSPYSRSGSQYGQIRMQDMVGMAGCRSHSFCRGIHESITYMDYSRNHLCGLGN